MFLRPFKYVARVRPQGKLFPQHAQYFAIDATDDMAGDKYRAGPAAQDSLQNSFLKKGNSMRPKTTQAARKRQAPIERAEFDEKQTMEEMEGLAQLPYMAEDKDDARRWALFKLIQEKTKMSERETDMVATLEKLDIYQQSEQLARLLSDKLDPKAKEYVASRLDIQNSPYLKVVSKQFSEENPDIAKEKHIEDIVNQDRDRGVFKNALQDSTVVNPNFFDSVGIPANPMDRHMRHLKRKKMTVDEYKTTLSKTLKHKGLKDGLFNRNYDFSKLNEETEHLISDEASINWTEDGRMKHHEKNRELKRFLRDIESPQSEVVAGLRTNNWEEVTFATSDERKGFEFDRVTDDFPGGPGPPDALYSWWKENRDGRLYDVVAEMRAINAMEREKKPEKFPDMGSDDAYFRELVRKYRGSEEVPNFTSEEIARMSNRLDAELIEGGGGGLEGAKIPMEPEEWVNIFTKNLEKGGLDDKQIQKEQRAREWDVSKAEFMNQIAEDDLHAFQTHYRIAGKAASMNKALRKGLAAQMIQLREKFNNTRNMKRKVQKELTKHYQGVLGKQATNSVLKYVEMEQSMAKQTKKAKLQEEIAEIASHRKEFNPDSLDAHDYECELNLISKLGLIQKKEETLNEFGFVVDCLHRNRVELTPTIRARLFEYASLNGSFGLANEMLSELSRVHSPIHAGYLEKYFKKCVRHDQLDGIAHLTNYAAENEDVAIGTWNIAAFRPALEYYLNDNFDLNKVMVFVKFYTEYTRSRAEWAHSIADSPQQLSEVVYANHADLVDMKNLVEFLTKKVGEKTVVDPITKKETLWELLSMFTESKEMFEISSEQIDVGNVADYLTNHIQAASTLERTFEVAQRLDSTEFTRLMLAAVQREYFENDILPYSFRAENVRKLYTKVKAAGELENLASAKELMFYLLKENNLVAEVLDFAGTSDSDITHYYVSEAILQTPLRPGQTYTNTLAKSQCESSACQITQKAKALFLDQGPAIAIAFLNEELGGLRQVQKQRQDFAVSLFDSLFPESPEDISYDEFRTTYFKGTALATQLAKESVLTARMDRILENKNYHEIELAFQLYAVLKEEHALVGKRIHFDMLVDQPDLTYEYTGSQNLNQVREVKERRQQLEAAISVGELQQIHELSKLIEGTQSQLLVDKSEPFLRYMKKMFEGYSLEQAQAVRKELEKSFKPDDQHDELSPIFEEWHSSTKSMWEDIFFLKDVIEPTLGKGKGYETEMIDHAWDRRKGFTMKDAARIATKNASQKGINLRSPDPHTHMHRNKRAERMLEQYREEYYGGRDGSTGMWTPDATEMYNVAQDATLLELKQSLMEAMTTRRQKALPFALQCFDKIRAKQFKMLDVGDIPEDGNIEETMQKLEMLLNNNTSPIISTIERTQKYQNQNLQNELEKLVRSPNIELQKHFPINEIFRDQKRLQLLDKETNRISKLLDQITDKLSQEQRNAKYKREGQDQWMKMQEERFTEKMDMRMEKLYKDFVQHRSEGHILSRAQKLSLMKDALTVDGESNFVSDGALPSFYAHDLVMFGIKRNFPDAVRAGEKLMIEAGEPMPREMAMAVKNFMLKNSEGYYSKDVMQRSGPLDTTKLYQSKGDGVQPLFCLDDPYWNNLLKKNYKREDQYKTPQVFAWAHKPDGILGEIFDMDLVRKRQEYLTTRMGM